MKKPARKPRKPLVPTTATVVWDARWKSMPNPTAKDLKDPEFEAIWQAIKSWDVNVPDYYAGYCGANGSHVMLILKRLRKARKEIEG